MSICVCTVLKKINPTNSTLMLITLSVFLSCANRALWSAAMILRSITFTSTPVGAPCMDINLGDARGLPKPERAVDLRPPTRLDAHSPGIKDAAALVDSSHAPTYNRWLPSPTTGRPPRHHGPSQGRTSRIGKDHSIRKEIL
jgi:hypothetical protein